MSFMVQDSGGGDGDGSRGKRTRHGGGAPTTDSGTDTLAHTAPKRSVAGDNTGTNAMVVVRSKIHGDLYTFKGLKEEYDSSEGGEGEPPAWWKFQTDRLRGKNLNGTMWIQSVYPNCDFYPVYIPHVSSKYEHNMTHVFHLNNGQKRIVVMRDNKAECNIIAYVPSDTNNTAPSDKQLFWCAALLAACTDVKKLKYDRDLAARLDTFMYVKYDFEISGDYTIALGEGEDALKLLKNVIVWQIVQHRLAFDNRRPPFTGNGLLKECEQHFQKKMGYKGWVLTPLVCGVCTWGDGQLPRFYAKTLPPAPVPGIFVCVCVCVYFLGGVQWGGVGGGEGEYEREKNKSPVTLGDW